MIVKLLRYLFILPLIFLLSSMLYSYPPGWSDDILISPDTARYRECPDISTDSQDNVWVIWDSTGWGGGYIYYSKRDSLGGCIIPETQVSTSSYSRYCRLEVDKSDNVHIVWRELSPQGYGLGYAKLANDGSVLIPAHLVVNGAGGGGPIATEIVLDQEKEIHIVWEETPTFFDQINYTLLDSLGDTLVSNVRVSTPDTSAYYPGIGVDSAGNNHIAYRSNSSMVERLIYIKLDKYGNVLVPHKTISTGSSPSIVCDRNQNVHIFYTNPEGPGNHIYYIKLDNNGNILISPTCLSLPGYDDNMMSHATIDSQQFLHIVWIGAKPDYAWILYTKMDTSGNIVASPMDVVYPPHTFWALYPRIAADNSDRLHLVWADGRIDTILRIFYKRGENENTVEETTQLKTTPLPKITVSPNPFNNSVTIRFFLGQSTSARTKNMELKIYDVSGKLVKEFNLKYTVSDIQSVIWDSRDNSGKQLPNGVYFLKFRIGDYSTTEKLLLIR